MRTFLTVFSVFVLTASVWALASAAAASNGAPSPASLTFTNFPLITPNGGSEPAVSIAPDGTVFFSGLSWQLFQTNLWKGSWGTMPAFQGGIDKSIGGGIGGEDADIDVGSTGTLHVTTLMFFPNPNFGGRQLGVSAIACPGGDTSDGFAHCTAQILDMTQTDRPWITSDGPVVYISYHDSGSSTRIHVWRSLDDGFTWKTVGDPITGQGQLTSMSTFDNDQGALVADPTTHDVFAVYAAGQGGLQKAKNANFNNIVVSRSEDKGMTWTPSLVFHAPTNTALNNVFPALAVDPVSGNLFASWSDAHTVSVSVSMDHGTTWSPAVVVNTAPATTAVLPALTARDGLVDLSYYGTTASSKDDPSAVWFTYLAQSTDGGATWTQSVVSDGSNHLGAICTFGIACAPGTRNLLDLFEVAINAQGKTVIIYTNDLLSTLPSGAKLPQVVVAYEN